MEAEDNTLAKTGDELERFLEVLEKEIERAAQGKAQSDTAPDSVDTAVSHLLQHVSTLSIEQPVSLEASTEERHSSSQDKLPEVPAESENVAPGFEPQIATLEELERLDGARSAACAPAHPTDGADADSLQPPIRQESDLSVAGGSSIQDPPAAETVATAPDHPGPRTHMGPARTAEPFPSNAKLRSIRTGRQRWFWIFTVLAVAAVIASALYVSFRRRSVARLTETPAVASEASRPTKGTGAITPQPVQDKASSSSSGLAARTDSGTSAPKPAQPRRLVVARTASNPASHQTDTALSLPVPNSSTVAEVPTVEDASRIGDARTQPAPENRVVTESEKPAPRQPAQTTALEIDVSPSPDQSSVAILPSEGAENLGPAGSKDIPAAPVVTTTSPPVPIAKVPPVYPEVAKRMNISGKVELHVRVDERGRVIQVMPLSGPAVLYSASIEAVRKWRFKPALLDGVAVPGEGKIAVVFNETK
jgi:protein TonB